VRLTKALNDRKDPGRDSMQLSAVPSIVPASPAEFGFRLVAGDCRSMVSWDFLHVAERHPSPTRLTALLAAQRFLPFQTDDWNRNKRGDGVYPSDMKHSIEDQAGKGYAGKVGTGC